MLVKPHGHSELSPRLVDETQRTDHLIEAKTLRSVRMTSRELSDLLMFGMGAYSPLEGFMNEESWRKCCTDYTTDQGLFWPIPITVSVPEDVASSISLGETIALIDENATIYGTLKVDETIVDKVSEMVSSGTSSYADVLALRSDRLSPLLLLGVWRAAKRHTEHQDYLNRVAERRRTEGRPPIPWAVLKATTARHEVAAVERAESLAPAGRSAEHRRRDAVKASVNLWNSCLAIARKEAP